jgi:cyclase
VTGQLVELAERVWAWVQPDGTWWVNNTGVIGGADGTVLVDTCATERRTRNLLDAVAEATGGAPIRCAVNTHAHGDHTYGNSLLPVETAIIGHERMRDALTPATGGSRCATPATPPTRRVTSSRGCPTSACSSRVTWSSTA